MLRMRGAYVSLVCCFAVIASGCHRGQPDNSALKTAINNYYSAHPACVWENSVKFPVQADASDNTQGYDALTDAGLLTRTPEEKKRFLIGSKQVNDYDVSDKGRSTWTPDPSQPGYGNFCFGHREVTSIDSVTSGSASGGAVNGASAATVNYHYDLAGVPDWAKSAEMQAAFQRIQTDLSGAKTATANLLNNGNGWQVSSGS